MTEPSPAAGTVEKWLPVVGFEGLYEVRDVTKDQRLPILCRHDERQGLLISNPPQCLCEYCGATWVYGTQAPICPILKKAYDAGRAAQNDATYAAVMEALEGLEIDREATEKHIRSKLTDENEIDQQILSMQIDADDRHDVLDDVRQSIAKIFGKAAPQRHSEGA